MDPASSITAQLHAGGCLGDLWAAVITAEWPDSAWTAASAGHLQAPTKSSDPCSLIRRKVKPSSGPDPHRKLVQVNAPPLTVPYGPIS